MPDKQATDYFFWHNLLSQRDEARSHKDTCITRPSDTTDTEKLQLFLGLVNYLQLFLPDIAAKTTFLREQVSKWDWTPSTDSAFQQLKQWICKTLPKTTLAYYDRSQPLRIQTDASEYGLDTALLQNNRPIAFASKTLTDVETRYANVECK